MNETVEMTNDMQPVAETPVAAVEPVVVPAAVAAPVASAATGRGHRKVRIGAVVSNKMQKSIIVTIERRVKHPLYKKYFTKTTRLMAHDEKQEARVGDVVKIAETRPLSKRKCWRLVEIIERAK